MLVGFVCFIIFLFAVYQLSKDDFLFIRKGISVDSIFDIIFLTLPVGLLSARIFYVLFHPSWHYLNPLIFFIVPYFPGLSLIGGILGAWIFIISYTKSKRIPSSRLMDMLSLSFLLVLCLGILLQAATMITHNRVLGVEEIARGVLGIMLYIVLLLQFIKASWIEGSLAFFIVSMYCALSYMNIATLFVLHQPVTFGAVISTGIIFLLFLIFFIQRQKLLKKLLGR